MSAQFRVTSRYDVAYCGREGLHHFLPVLLRGMLPLFSIMTLCSSITVSYETKIVKQQDGSIHKIPLVNSLLLQHLNERRKGAIGGTSSELGSYECCRRSNYDG